MRMTFEFTARWSTVVSISILALLVGCSSPENYLRPAEMKLGTHSTLSRSFHVVADEPQGFGLRFPGLIIGLEKADRAEIASPKLEDDVHLRESPTGFSEDALSDYHSILNDGRRTFVSHIVESTLDTNVAIPYLANRFLYDAYAAYDVDRTNGDTGGRRPSLPLFEISGDGLYDRSWNSLAALEEHVATTLGRAACEGEPYTHVVVSTMGWNTDQEKAIRNINSINGNLLIAAGDRDDFKPLYIAITWPSEWAIGGLSLFNKANDADEIGFVWANALINRHLARLRDLAGDDTWPEFRIVAIGHSLGARLVTRAAFSGEALAEGAPLSNGADLVIGLQGAFSTNRFLKERSRGQEGAPYADYERLRGRIALTWSREDSANPLANFITGANYVGGTPGWQRAHEERYRKHFIFWSASESGELLDEPGQPNEARRVAMIEASSIVKFSVLGAGGGAHSDIYNAYMGRLLLQLIDRLAPSSETRTNPKICGLVDR